MGLMDAIRNFTAMTAAGYWGRTYSVTSSGVPVELSSYMMPDSPDDMSTAQLWASQPALRTVVDFLATNVAHLGLHVFESVGDERRRVRNGVLSEFVRRPNENQTCYDFVAALVTEWALYANVFIWVYERGGRRHARIVPSRWVTPVCNAFGIASKYVLGVINEDSGQSEISLPGDRVCWFKGWTPEGGVSGTSPVDSLRLILEEQHAAKKYRKQIWQRAGRYSGMFLRPTGAPAMDDLSRRRFMEMVRAFTGTGPRAGEDMLLEEGTEYKRIGFSAREEEYAAAQKLALETVAQVYQVNPAMVGVLDNANYSNMREFNRSLYTNTLGPLIKMIEDRFNSFLLPMLSAAPGHFVEFNVESKLRGSFEEQSNVMTRAVGGPWMTRNEGRRIMNLPPLDSGDELIVPLNVSEGGQSSPLDGGEGRPVKIGDCERIVHSFLVRQSASVSARKHAGSDWWNKSRWVKELTDDLVAAGVDAALAAAFSLAVNARAFDTYESGAAPSDNISILFNDSVRELE